MNRTTLARWITTSGLLAVFAVHAAGPATAAGQGPKASSIVPPSPGGSLVIVDAANQGEAVLNNALPDVAAEELPLTEVADHTFTTER